MTRCEYIDSYLSILESYVEYESDIDKKNQFLEELKFDIRNQDYLLEQYNNDFEYLSEMEEFNKKTEELKNLFNEFKSSVKEARSFTKQKDYKSASKRLDTAIKNLEGVKTRLKDTNITFTSFLLGDLATGLLMSLESIAISLTLIAAPVVAAAKIIHNIKIMIDEISSGKAINALDIYRTTLIRYCNETIILLKLYKKNVDKNI